MDPESRGSEMLQSGVHFPAAKSSVASRANASSFPALTSAFNCWSHPLAWNSQNQSASCATSSGESWEMAASISSTLMPVSIDPAGGGYKPRPCRHRAGAKAGAGQGPRRAAGPKRGACAADFPTSGRGERARLQSCRKVGPQSHSPAALAAEASGRA
jgi:hypothetical protein